MDGNKVRYKLGVLMPNRGDTRQSLHTKRYSRRRREHELECLKLKKVTLLICIRPILLSYMKWLL